LGIFLVIAIHDGVMPPSRKRATEQDFRQTYFFALILVFTCLTTWTCDYQDLSSDSIEIEIVLESEIA
jgi:hypothetical protein